jgi:hypothetical protein
MAVIASLRSTRPSVCSTSFKNLAELGNFFGLKRPLAIQEIVDWHGRTKAAD